MRRLKVPPDQPTGFYHCLSRVVDRRFIFDPPEKEHFAALIRECETFCRVRVLTFCLMSNEVVEGIFRAYRERFGPQRKTGARPIKGHGEGGLYVLRDLRLNVFG